MLASALMVNESKLASSPKHSRAVCDVAKAPPPIIIVPAHGPPRGSHGGARGARDWGCAFERHW